MHNRTEVHQLGFYISTTLQFQTFYDFFFLENDYLFFLRGFFKHKTFYSKRDPYLADVDGDSNEKVEQLFTPS